MDALVIGAGAAGLASARELRGRGMDVLVLEARDRNGGRIHTIRSPDWPLPLDAGAEFIHGHPPVLLELASGRRELARSFYGAGLQRRDDLWRKVMAKLRHLPSRRECSVQKAFASSTKWVHAPPDERRLALAYLEGFNAAPVARASIRAIAQQTRAADRIQGDHVSRMPGGYDVVVRRLSRGTSVELGARVTEVHWGGGKVRVLAGGVAYEAERAVLTLPLGVLQARTVRFVPELPGWKERAIAALAMGAVVKIALLFERAHWPDDLVFLNVPDLPVPTFWRLLPSNLPVLMGWTSSGGALRLSRKDAVRTAVASLSRALGEKVRPKRAMVFEWQDDPDARGAYSWVPVGALSAQRALAARVGPLFFAGEATHFDGACATVHGAIETGIRAARELMAGG
jgi:monoamine oxidase